MRNLRVASQGVTPCDLLYRRSTMSMLLLLPCAAAGLLAPSLPSLPKIGNLASTMAGPRCDKLLPTLFSETVDPAAVAAACSSSVEWVDMDLKDPIRGPEAVEAHLAAKFPAGSKLMIERLSDGGRSGGFSWHREADGVEGSGLRGVTYVELDDAGQIAYVQEGAEPIFKLDKLLEALLTAANANKKDDDGKPPPSYVKATPTSANGIVKYLWEVAYPGGATPSEALTFFSDDILYEDFNYREPFVGIEQVRQPPPFLAAVAHGVPPLECLHVSR